MTTIIKVKYIEYLSNYDEIELNTTTEKEILINVNCPIKMILKYIRNVARLNSTCEFDLCDDVNCKLQNVSFYKPYTRGTDILQTDLTYFIITFERDENKQMVNLTPLLTAKTTKRCEILSKLSAKRPSRKNLSIKSALKKHNN